MSGRAGSPVPVVVTRKRVRNLNLRVRRDGTVALSTPLGTSQERVRAFVEGHASWILSHVARQHERTRLRHELEREAARPITSYPLWGKTRHAPKDAPLSREELSALYRSEVERELPAIVMYMEGLMGAHATSWQLREMKTRWGSCTPKTGRIRINTRLAAYPTECLCYVVVHELAHLLEPSHNARFHEVVARAIPNEAELRARLRQPPALKGRQELSEN